MRIHTDRLNTTHLWEAARIARVDMDLTAHGSRKRDRAYNVTLSGESRRRPNLGTSRNRDYEDRYAATWDQWGVFLAVLFARDPDMATPYYADADEFHSRTGGRFNAAPPRAGHGTDAAYWPADAHGDHTFRFAGTPGEQSCTKCSAVQRW